MKVLNKARIQKPVATIVNESRDDEFDTTTTSYVARTAFQNSAIATQICGVPESVFENLSILYGNFVLRLPDRF